MNRQLQIEYTAIQKIKPLLEENEQLKHKIAVLEIDLEAWKGLCEKVEKKYVELTKKLGEITNNKV